MPDIRPRRSVLYMPGANARALEKARTLPADAIIIDLEDAVAPEAKEAARAQVVAALRQGGYGAPRGRDPRQCAGHRLGRGRPRRGGRGGARRDPDPQGLGSPRP